MLDVDAVQRADGVLRCDQQDVAVAAVEPFGHRLPLGDGGPVVRGVNPRRHHRRPGVQRELDGHRLRVEHRVRPRLQVGEHQRAVRCLEDGVEPAGDGVLRPDDELLGHVLVRGQLVPVQGALEHLGVGLLLRGEQLLVLAEQHQFEHPVHLGAAVGRRVRLGRPLGMLDDVVEAVLVVDMGGDVLDQFGLGGQADGDLTLLPLLERVGVGGHLGHRADRLAPFAVEVIGVAGVVIGQRVLGLVRRLGGALTWCRGGHIVLPLSSNFRP